MSPFHPDASLYCMVLNNSTEREVEIGSLGTIQWPKGWTYYVGRAHYGWSSRLKRFTEPDQSLHWHIDYLVDVSDAKLTHVLVLREPGDRECDLAGWISDIDCTEPLSDGFGASDCPSGCTAHGFCINRSPETLQSRLVDSHLDIAGMIRFEDTVCISKPNP